MILLNDFKRQWNDVAASVHEAVEKVGQSGWLILGSEVEQFEKQLAIKWGFAHAIGVANGMDALEISLRVIGLKSSDYVLTTPLSAFATTLAVMRIGATPVFVDTDDTGLLDLDICEKILQQRPEIKFFLPVHLFGHAINLEKMKSLKERFQLKIIEDCAQAILAKSKGVFVGQIGELAATSFYPTKNLGCMGDGGAIMTNDPHLAKKCRSLRDYGQSQKYVHSEFGLNSRLDELQAGVLSTSFLPRLDKWTQKRKEIAAKYINGIKNSLVQLPKVPLNSDGVWHLFPVSVGNHQSTFQAFLKGHGISSGVHYPSLITEQPALLEYKKFQIEGSLEKATLLTKVEVSLPIHPYLTTEEIDLVIQTINQWKI